MTTPEQDPLITTHSVGEALDFACNLLAVALGREAETVSERTASLLLNTATYISLRYAGEYGLAIEYLNLLADELGPEAEVPWSQFWAQMKWISNKFGNE